MNLSPAETRVLGCLLEKQATTPDLYPLTLNSLRLACNQATNRDPVVDYDDEDIRDALHRLQRRGLTRLASGAGSRAPKYRHLLAEKMPLSADQQAVMTVLMLRGSQTPGELKARTERMYRFEDRDALTHTLDAMIAADLVEMLPRRPGQKEERYRQRMSESHTGDDSLAIPDVPAGPGAPASADQRSTLVELQHRITAVERRLDALEGLPSIEHRQTIPAGSAGPGS